MRRERTIMSFGYNGRGVHLKKDEQPLRRQTVFDAEELGKALRKRRRELGYTQAMAAELSMHSPRVIGEIERGRSSVGIGVIFDYAAILGVDVDLRVRGAE